MQVIQKNRLFRQAGMQRRFLFVLAAFSGVFSAQAAFASNITVASPLNGTTTPSPVWIRAHNVGCNGLGPTAFGYSIDSSGTTTLGVTPYDIDVAHQSIGAGKHTIHFKAWTTAGVCPVVDSSINVAGRGAHPARADPATRAAQAPPPRAAFLPTHSHRLIWMSPRTGRRSMMAVRPGVRGDRPSFQRLRRCMTTLASST